MEKGTTLAECLVSVSLAAVLAVTALPSLTLLIAKNRLEAATNLIRQDLSFARANAVTLHRPVTIKPLSANCWSCGWLVQTKADANLTGDLDQHLARRDPLERGVTLTSNRPFQAGVTFMPTGAAAQPNGAFAAGTFTLCMPGSQQHFKVIISKSGRTRVSRKLTPCS
jgi:type IV fimbrial biogenesis protein FimT